MPKRRANGEGSIYRRKDGLWAAAYTDNAGKRRSVYGKGQQLVREKLKAAIRESDKGLNMDKSKILFTVWLAEWLEVYKKPVVTEKVYMLYYQDIHQRTIPYFQNVTLKDLREDMLQKFFNKQALKRYDGKEGEFYLEGRRRMYLLINAALERAVRNDIITKNVAKHVELPKKKKPEVEMLTVEEQKKLESAVLEHDNPLAFSILLALYTGLRIGELAALRISDIDFEAATLTVQRSITRLYSCKEKKSTKYIAAPKTEKSKRVIPLPGFMLEMLRDFISERNKRVELLKEHWGAYPTPACESRIKDGVWVDDGSLFVTMYGSVLDNTNFNKMLKKCLEMAGVKRIYFHALRHTFATRCVEAGFDIKSLSEILGHTDAKVTLNTYVHALDEQKRNNMDKLGGLWEQNEDKKE